MTKKKFISDLNTQEYLVLFRHWKWADLVREQYEKSEEKFGTSLLFEQKNGFKFIWYGLVYVLIEFMEDKDLIFLEIAEKIDKYKDSLRLCRNATFHIQSNLFTDKYKIELLLSIADKDILKIHTEIGKNVRIDLKRRFVEVPKKIKILHNVFENSSEQEMIHKLYFLQGHYV